MTDINEIIQKTHPSIPFPDKIKLGRQVAVFDNLLKSHDTLRKMTIVDILYKMHVEGFKEKLK